MANSGDIDTKPFVNTDINTKILNHGLDLQRAQWLLN